MDSVSQPAEEKEKGNDQSEQSKENSINSISQENSPAQEPPEQQKHDEQTTTGSDQTSGSKNLSNSSSDTQQVKQPPPADQGKSAIEDSTMQEQISQSETEMQPNPEPPVPELTLVGKFEISPITTATEISTEGSLKLECPQSGVDLFQNNKSQTENEKSGTTTFEVNSFRDGDLKIANESLGTLSSTSSPQNDVMANEKNSNLCNRESSKIESIQQERKDIAESSSYTVTSDKNNKSVQPDSCEKGDDSAANILENDFLLDSNKSKETAAFVVEREVKSVEKMNLSTGSSSSSSNSNDGSSEEGKGIENNLCNYSSIKILNTKNENEKSGTEFSDENRKNNSDNKTEVSNDYNRKSTEIKEKATLSNNKSNFPTTSNASSVSSLVEQNVVHGDSAKFQDDKEFKSTVRDSTDISGNSNTGDNVVSSSNNVVNSNADEQNSSSCDLNRTKEVIVESGVTRSTVKSSSSSSSSDLSELSRAESSTSISSSYANPPAIQKDRVKDESKPKEVMKDKVNDNSNRLERQNSSDSSSNIPTSFQNYQSATKDFVASKIRHFYDNKSAVNSSNSQENRLNRSNSETLPRTTQHSSGYSNYYDYSKANETSGYNSSHQYFNISNSNSLENMNHPGVTTKENSKVEKVEQRQPESSYAQQFSEKVNFQNSEMIKSSATWQTENQTNYQNYIRDHSKNYTIDPSASNAKPHSSTNSNSSRISGMDTIPHLTTNRRLSSSAPEQNHQNDSKTRINTINPSPNQTRETEYQRYMNAINQVRKEELTTATTTTTTRKSSLTMPEQIQSHVESQIRTSTVDHHNQSQESDYQKYMNMVQQEKVKEYQRQVIYNQKMVNSTMSQGTNSMEALNRSNTIQNHTDLSARSSHTQNTMGLLNRPSSVQNHAEAMRRPSPVQNHTEAMRRPSPVQNHTEAMRRPSPVQNHAEAMRRPSPVQNHTDALRRPSPVQITPNAQNHSLYINNPDFSKQMQQKQRTTSSASNNDLSQLHMKPPDFSKVASAQQRQITPPQQSNKSKEKVDCYKQGNPLQITQQNFAEISKRYNYISDLQLKNPPPGEEKSSCMQTKAAPYNNLYVKVPDFSTEKFQNKPALERSSSFEQQQQQQQHQHQQQLQLQQHNHQSYTVTKSSSNPSVPNLNENLYARQFPQLSHDVELSVVPQKSSTYHTESSKNFQEKPSSYCDYQNHNKNALYTQDAANKIPDRNTRSSIVNEQYKRETSHYQNRTAPSEYPTSYGNPVHLQARDQYHQAHIARQSYPTESKLSVPNEQPTQAQVSSYEAPRYDPKVQQDTFPQNYHREAYANYNYSQNAQSVIQSSKAKECYPEYSHHVAQTQVKPPTEYPAMNPAHRQVLNSSYYSMPQQQATPPTPPSSANSIPSPSQMTSTRPYSNQMQQQQQQTMSNPPSPACHAQGSYKTTPSPGTMNPPYGWPSQVVNSRIPQGTSSSPHAVYRQQSPVGMNAPSPHSQSPSFLQPSPKPSPSPTNLMSRPSPQAPSMHMNYKPPYAQPAQNISPYYQQGDHSRNSSYFVKTEKPLDKSVLPEPSTKQCKPPVIDSKQDLSQYRQLEAKQDLRPNEYPPSAGPYTQKPTTSKRADYPEYPPTATRRNEPQKNAYKYPPHLNETVTRPEYHPALGKATSDLSINKSNQKPNYREMINHVYAIRNATSETELNAEIIKRTLKKDITRRSDSDLSKNIFDSPDPTKNCGYYARSTECLPAALRNQQDETKKMETYMTPKYANPLFDPNRRPSQPETSKSRTFEYPERKTNLPLCSELARNDISVTVSKVIKPAAVSSEKPKPLERSTQSLHGSYPSGSEFSSVVISKVNLPSSVDHSVPGSQRSKETTRSQQTVPETSKPKSSVFSPMKRESPLDLSVKTVKTKADSTGCDDVNSYQSRTNASAASALKVDFAPNFSKHTIGDDGIRTNVQPPPNAYEPRYPSSIAPLNNRSCPQPSQNNRYNTVSQSRSNQQQTTSVPPHHAPQHFSQSTHHQYSSTHHLPSQQQHVPPEASQNNMLPIQFPSNRPNQAYPSHHLSSRETATYPYQHNQMAYVEQKPTNQHLMTPQQQQYIPPTQPHKQSHEPQKVECQKPKENLYQLVPGTSSYPPSESKLQNPYINPYLPLKREPENVKQSVILNPPMPGTVYDKKSDDYLMNTPQHQKRNSEKIKETDLSKNTRAAEPTSHLQQKYPEPHQGQENALRYGSSNVVKNTRQDVVPPPAVVPNHIEQRYPNPNLQKQYANLHPQYDRTRCDTKPRIQEEYVKKVEEPKTLNAPVQSSLIHEQYSHYPSTIPTDSHKSSSDYKVHPITKADTAPERNDSLQDRFRPSDYHRKRPPEPIHNSGKNYQPPEKQIRVDELYRAHLEETYRQQQKQHQQQQQQQSHSQNNLGHQYERRDMSVIQPTGEATIKNDPSVHINYAAIHHCLPTQYGYPYKDGYQQPYIQQSRESTTHAPTNYHHPQAQQPWYPQSHLREKIPQEATNVIKREPYSYHPQYNDSAAQNSELERSRIQQEHKKQVPTPPEIVQKSTVPPTSTASSNNVLRGADQHVISKLRTSIEMREYEKQRTSLLKKQASVGEIGEEDTSKPDIASLLAARIRTKGELKGFTPLPQTPPNKIKEPEKETAPESKEVIVPVLDPFSEGEEEKSLNLLDWGSTCNDFVEQLLTGNSKKRKKRRNTKGGPMSSESNTESVNKETKNFPGTEYSCDTDKTVIKTEAAENGKSIKTEEVPNNKESCSSDEDKPLLQLRKQKGSDANIAVTPDPETKTQKSPKLVAVGCSDMKSQDSDSTTKSNRNSLVGKLNEKVVRNIREKQRLEQERRLAARLSRTSSSDSEDEVKRNIARQKRPLKPRSRASGASTREISETDSSGDEDKIMSRNLIRSRLESRKRRRVERLSTDSEPSKKDPSINPKKSEKYTEGKNSNLDNQKEKTSVEKEMITKARVKCMKLSTESSDSSEENGINPANKEVSEVEKGTRSKLNTVPDSKILPKEETEDESNVDQSKLNYSSPCKPRNKKTLSRRQSVEEAIVKETMTRSKRKKELEQQIANSKILRNDKVVQNIIPIERRVKSAERTPNKSIKTPEKPPQEEKSKPSPSKGKCERIEELKRKHCENESDDKVKKKRFAKEGSSSSSSDSSKESEEETVSDRVRSRRSRLSNERNENETFLKTSKKLKNKEKPKEEPAKNATGKSKKSTTKSKSPENSGSNTEKFPPGWELEVYHYKRALKVPASLISIKGPVHHRVSTSLPDLDPHSSDASESFSPENAKQSATKVATEETKQQQHQSKNLKKGNKTKKDKQELQPEPEPKKEKEEPVIQPKSIIDVLHSRMLKTKKVHKKSAKTVHSNEPKILPRGNNEAELLPTPASVKDNKNPFAHEHHSLFETEVLKSRTRTEYRILKNKELIREVFGGEDRPASAPPEIGEMDDLDIKVERITFDQKYQQYLQKMNVDFGEKIRKNKKPQSLVEGNEPKPLESTEVVIKTEKLDEDSATILNHVDEETQDTEINECFQTPVAIKEEIMDTNERNTPSITSEREGVVTPLIFKRRKVGKNRSGRRKGSSGFDYIRKKKKVATNTHGTQDVIKRKRTSPVELFHTRDESDVSKEIQKWVLNKSVGQSALHKAARLGYLDVIAYCLERLGMHPDPKDNAGYTPLHEACTKGRIDIARVLLQYGANHSETAHSGIRPLHEASENGYIEIVRLLLSYGADPLLTTYSGQTPLMLAESPEMEQFLKNHLQDVQNTGPHKQPWKFPGPWKIYDPEEYGYDVLAGAPEPYEDEDEDMNKDVKCDISEQQKNKEKCDTNSNIMINNDEKIKKSSFVEAENVALKTKLKSLSTKCTVVLDNIDSLDHINSVKQFNDCHSKLITRRRSTFEKRDLKAGRIPEESEGEGEAFEFEESDIPLPPLYLLKDEGTEKWVLLNDLCNLLKVKSKDTLLKQICPSIPPSTVNKELLRELKMSDFLERATCLQLLCAGEKLNISSSKVVLVKYNESVRNLLGVKTILMKF